MNDPVGVASELRSLYGKYLDSAQPLRHEGLMRERADLLGCEGTLHRDPLIEPVPRYEEVGTLSEACRDLGLSPEFADFSSRGAFSPGRKLYSHQWEALKEVCVRGRSMVVTTGTGSGKTECFLLPVIESLVRESGGWLGLDRPKAVRALILYPLNALVEDQMSRLRRSLDGPEAREWVAANRRDRFTFGRYNGRTPISGGRTPQKKAKWQDELRKLQRRARSLSGLGDEVRQQFPSVDPDSGERWDRWTIQDNPPDVLVTNYSMLNIMLMRAIEANIFVATRVWLESDRGRVFHLVVDELHTYRGTPGSEVAYLVRLLLGRLGLSPDSPQVRFLASSASLDSGEKGARYLEGFFGLAAAKFAVLSDFKEVDRDAPVAPLARHASAFAAFSGATDEGVAALAAGLGVALPEAPPTVALSGLIEAVKGVDAVRSMVSRPMTPTEWGTQVFGLSGGTGREAAAGLMRALASARTGGSDLDPAPLPLRAHLFFRNLTGLWACADPACSEVPSVPSHTPRPVGKLYSHPKLRCDCGSTVLDVIVCQACGEVYLGGTALATTIAAPPSELCMISPTWNASRTRLRSTKATTITPCSGRSSVTRTGRRLRRGSTIRSIVDGTRGGWISSSARSWNFGTTTGPDGVISTKSQRLPPARNSRPFPPRARAAKQIGVGAARTMSETTRADRRFPPTGPGFRRSIRSWPTGCYDRCPTRKPASSWSSPTAARTPRSSPPGSNSTTTATSSGSRWFGASRGSGARYGRSSSRSTTRGR
ncbi:DEAD/DEAH box helicase [Paludisphaera borealis]|uniref:DEAD/DEAH box helicase n=1 Tax=Paludisphaera borealis TaxID=1387353 RepID=UPI0009706243|nr:DEAD/DEAH box helicase [Paludisphaera borealis]